MKSSNKGRILPYVFLLMGSTVLLFAGGESSIEQDSSPLSELELASNLIEEGQLDKAMGILADIGKAYPSQIELIQRLVLRIMGIKGEITELFREVRSILDTEELSLDQKIAATEEVMQKIKLKDRDSAGDTWRKISIVESALGRDLDLLRREIFFAKGNEKLERKLYLEAIHEYKKGFIDDSFGESQTYEKYRDAVNPSDIEVISSFPQREQTIFEAYKRHAPEGDRVISELTSLIDRWTLTDLSSSRNVNEEPAALSSDNLAGWIGNDSVNSLNLEYQEAETMLLLGSQLSEVMDQLYESLDGIPEDFRYDRVLSFLNGRNGRENAEGIILAQRLHWESKFFEILFSMLNLVSSTYYEGLGSYQSRLWTKSMDSFLLSELNSGHAVEFTALAEDYLEGLPDAGISRFTNQLEPLLLELQTITEASKIRMPLVEIASELPETESENLLNADIESVRVLSGAMRDSVNQVENLLVDWDRYSNQIAENEKIVNANVQKIVNDLKADLLGLLQSLSLEKSSAFFQYFEPRYEMLDSRVRDLIQESEKSIVFVDNLLGEIRPRAAIDLRVAPFLESIEILSESIDDFILTVTSTQETELDDDIKRKLIDYGDKTNALLADIAQLRKQWLDIQGDVIARQNAALRAETVALAALGEADELLKAAREADIQGRASNNINDSYRAKDSYSLLVETLSRVRDLFLEIGSNDIDIASDSGIQERLTELERAAYNEPRSIAVTVREYAISEADKFFAERLFDDGLELLLLAQEFWISVFGEEDTRLKLRLVRFRTAQRSALKTRIEPSDPLFREMNQYLNLANQRYQVGISRLESNTAGVRDADVLKLFSEAEALIQQVLNIFSGNAAALLLQMKILKVREPDEYNRMVRKLIEDANTAVRNGNEKALVTGIGFVPPIDPKLQAVSAFDPDFPGLFSTIERVDIYLGRIILLPTQAEIEESVRITESVRNDWRQALELSVDVIEATSPGLIERLDSALNLWENNIDAVNLQDEIRFYTQPRALPDNLRNLITVADEQRLQNNRSSVEAIYQSIISSFPIFIRHPEVMRIKYWLDIE